MEKECLRHSVQDVVVPYAIMLKVALEITKLRQTDAYKKIFPALNEAWNFPCRSLQLTSAMKMEVA
jgi:hypothetical protein